MKKPQMTDLQKRKIAVAYLAWKDIGAPGKSPYNHVLKDVFDLTLGEIGGFFQLVGESWQDVIQAFRIWEFTLYPRISIGFEPQRNVLIVNLWSWMFSMLSNIEQSEIGFAPLFLKASELVHEFQHYVYLNEHGMIGVPEEESELFRENHGGLMEEEAFRKQVNVLQKYKEVADPETFLITFKVDAWENGRKCKFAIIKEHRQKTADLIDRLVRQYEEAIELAKEDASASKYNEESDKHDCEINEAISKALNLPIDVRLDKTHFKTISVCV
jgi:hypothetical protein